MHKPAPLQPKWFRNFDKEYKKILLWDPCKIIFSDDHIFFHLCISRNHAKRYNFSSIAKSIIIEGVLLTGGVAWAVGCGRPHPGSNPHALVLRRPRVIGRQLHCLLKKQKNVYNNCTYSRVLAPIGGLHMIHEYFQRLLQCFKSIKFKHSKDLF